VSGVQVSVLAYQSNQRKAATQRASGFPEDSLLSLLGYFFGDVWGTFRGKVVEKWWKDGGTDGGAITYIYPRK
jgi:hypothetical protein